MNASGPAIVPGDRNDTAEGGHAAGVTPLASPEQQSRQHSTRRWRGSAAWLGLVPFFAFVFVFLFLPAWGVIDKGARNDAGGRSGEYLGRVLNREGAAIRNSFVLSLVSALSGAIVGTMVAYAAITAKRPRWLRTLVTSFSGVAANMGGVVLAFAFLCVFGRRQGVLTKLLNWAGVDIYDQGFSLTSTFGFNLVYLYFQIPLMMLVMLPALDGLRPAWREAASNLGGTATTYWRRVGLPVLMPSLLGGFLLLFANAFSAFATAYALGPSAANLMPTKISNYLQGDVAGKSPMPYALATWMIIIVAVVMACYLLLRRRAERWSR